MSIVSQKKKNIEKKKSFYEENERWYNTIPKYNVNIVLGTTMLKQEKRRHKPAIIIPREYIEFNENRRKLMEIALGKHPRIATYFHHHSKEPDKKTVNQIYFDNKCQELSQS